MQLLLFAALSLLTATNAVGPADLLTSNVPDGFDLAVDPPIDLTFDEYAPLSPDATAHVDPATPGALAMRAAVDVWTSGDDDVLLREITRWSTEEEARAFVEQSVVVGTEDDLSVAGSPFEGGIAFIGADEGLWIRTLTWRQGPYGVTIGHFATSEGSDQVIESAAQAIVDKIADATGLSVAGAGALESEPEPTTTAGGVPIVAVLLVAFMVGGTIVLFMRLRHRQAAESTQQRGRGQSNDDEPADVDDIIERARARGRAEREVDAIPDPTAEWTPPDDY